MQDRLKKNAKIKNQFQNGLKQVKKIWIKKRQSKLTQSFSQIKKMQNIFHNILQNKIAQIKKEINLSQEKLKQFKERLNLLEKRQSLSQNGLNQIAKMQSLSQKELEGHKNAKPISRWTRENRKNETY